MNGMRSHEKSFKMFISSVSHIILMLSTQHQRQQEIERENGKKKALNRLKTCCRRHCLRENMLLPHDTAGKASPHRTINCLDNCFVYSATH